MVNTDIGNQRRFTRDTSGGFSGGFTVIEVILFLAISGLLLFVAIASVTANINNSRFNDAIRSTTSYLQTQYSEVSAGQSDRDTSKGCDTTGSITNSPTALGMSDCVVMGRYIKLEGATFTVRYIIGYRATLLGIPAGDTAAINAMNPQVANDAYEGRYDIPWDIHMAKATALSGTYDRAGIAIIRSPASGSVLYYVAAPGDASPAPSIAGTLIRDDNLSQDVTLCFADDSSSRTGRITIGNGQGQDVIKTDLATTGACS